MTKQDNLKDIEDRILAQEQKQKAAKGELKEKKIDKYANNKGFNIVTNLIGGIVVMGFVGFFLDYFLDKSPIFFIASIPFGFAIGFYNVYKYGDIDKKSFKK